MRNINESQYKKIIEMYSDQVDKEVSAMTAVMSSWGRNSEIGKLVDKADKKKKAFKKLFE